ncbi:glycosyl hydrolase [Hallerella succinigenes]|uniref:Putative secreted protein (Por secretion system target) n=1 Tax=Hallerella succinigenes TaxID=1896222 RepID=A0A2M9A909_9BACT|nr:glycosyl hydrolase [Hallerella succinigenes]PJJ42211.1 putative secreted protein (Por secretion system target) [Hallerella succinigenes]
MNLLKKSLLAAGFCALTAQADVSYTPVNANATEGAQKLYNFLATNYGVKTVSGMMTGDVSSSTLKELPDVTEFYKKTGKYPALVGFDFLFATGVKASDDWYQSYTQMALEAAKDLWNQGGIPAFTWHWKDPSDQIDAFYTKSGNANEYTEFDFTQGFTDPSCTVNCTWNTSSETYQQLVNDIDEIADMFLGLQEAGVAAIFRPLHEASGKWFWWGSKGGAAFQALYNLVYDEMVSVKGVNNLVWVWNPEYSNDIGWNPGASKYDVISLDIYEAWDYSTKYTKAYSELLTNFGSDKILAVSENGSIPDISVMKANNIAWSWWMPWYQTWDGKFLDQTVDAVWKANLESACTISLENMPGWNSYTLSTSKVAACEAGYALGDLDTARAVEVVVPGDTATNGWLRASISTSATSDTAKGNVIIQSGSAIDLSTASTITFNVYNTNKLSGIWFTIAFLGNASTSWAWAQPDGCWIDAGDSTTCTIDLSTTAKDQVVLTGTDYTSFMSHISKVYIEIFAVGFNGDVYYDAVKTNTGVTINDFDNTAEKIEVEQAQNLSAQIIGLGKGLAIEKVASVANAVKMSVQNRTLSISVPKSGKANIALFDVTGHQVKSFNQGSLSAGEHQFNLSGIPQGNYILQVKGVGFSSTKSIRIQ